MSLRTDRLKKTREEKGWSKREFAQLCGFNELQIYRYETGANDPSTDTVIVMSRILAVSTDYLLGLSDNPTIQIREPGLDDNERTILEIYRREGWQGVARFSVEKLGER